MRTVICNSIQSFWDMAENQFLEGHNVHCVFPVTDKVKSLMKIYQQQYRINQITYSEVFN
ncbi:MULTISPECIES: hypothetical protein [Vibrio]|uniref:Exonuclease V subunit gamma n=2 Tax=Vibrio TaxID=662 RepID=A0A2C9P7R0_9VIBR|nr:MULTISPECIES: hypothetical protein [Vibrio]ASI88781.1 hypothetical protein BSZ05_02505 [Vibrio mediterranei]AYV20736.1 hypothetical protein ECB94_05170 [Vibrio mediterranei]EDL54058.1 hypothetical protein VSAK1_08611 [Vibrio mediterranei AK1]MCF4175061.1 hypothetical protein [Vibrio sp. McD22-P3]MCG9626812.1 hypothetical protein [Vibrio mediterranei]